MGSRKEYEMLFRLSAQLGQNFNGTFTAAQKTLAATEKEIQSLNKLQADISSYTKQQQSITALNGKLSTYKQQLANVRQEIASSGEYSSTLANKELELKQRVEETEAKIKAKTDTVERMREALSGAGIDTSTLADESEKLGNRIEALRGMEEAAAAEAEQLGSAGVNAMDAIAGTLAAAGATKAIRAVYDEFNACIDAAIEFESVMTGVAKTTDFTDDEFAAVSKEIKELSQTIPATTKELGSIAETAGQLGIAKADLMDFTEIMAMLGTATNMTSDEAATLLAQFASITGMDASNYSNLGSTIVALGNAYATTEKNVAEMSQTIAAAGSISGMSEADILAISAAVTSLGISAQNGGTQMTKLISEINSAVSSGEDLDRWASVAQMSAEEFATAWRENAAGALNQFIVGLNSAYTSGEDIYSMLNDLGISETRMVTMITSLAKSGDRLTDTLGTANVAWSENNALTAEAEKRYSTTESKLTLLQNSYSNLHATIGEQFMPELGGLAELGADILQGVNDFVTAYPNLSKALTVMALEVATITAAYLGYAGAKKTLNAAKALGITLTAKQTVATGAETAATNSQTAATGAATTAQTGLNAAMAANPVGAVITAVVVLTGAMVGFASAANKANDPATKLIGTIRKQKEDLEQLNAEYEETSKAYGETSEEALRLRYEIDELSASIEVNGQTLEEFINECDELVDSTRQMIADYRATTEEIKENEIGTLALIQKLSDLAAQNVRTTATEEQMKAIIAELNEQLPELSLSYDDVASSAANYVEVMKKLAKQRAEDEQQEARMEAYTQALIKQEELKQQIVATAKELEIAREEAPGGAHGASWAYLIGGAAKDRAVRLLENELEDLRESLTETESTIEKINSEWSDLYDSQQETAESTEEIAEQEKLLAKALFAVQNGFLSAEQAASYYGVDLTKLEAKVSAVEADSSALAAALKAVRAGFMNVDEAAKAFGVTVDGLGAYRSITEITDEINDLSEAYQEAYEKAYDSISGQYKLWDKAAEVIPDDISEINAALETQTAYWHDYNVDLASLKERSGDIEGLSDVIASFADGSSESVNAVAGMAQASDEELRKMVEQWKLLQTQQQEASESLGETAGDYTSTIEGLQEQLKSMVDGLNLDEEAKAAAEATMDAYIKAFQEGADEAATIAQQLANQVGGSLNITNGGTVAGGGDSGGTSGGVGGGTGSGGTISQEQAIAEKIVQFGDAWGEGMNASKSGDNGIVHWGGSEYKIQNSGTAYDSSTPLYKAAVDILGFNDRQIFGYNQKIYGYLDGHIQELEGRTLSKKGYKNLETAVLSNYGSYHTGGLVGEVATITESEEFAKLLKGEFVSTPAQMKRFMTETLPQIAEYDSATSTSTSATPAEAAPVNGASYTITISPQFTVQGVNDDMEEKIRDCGDMIVDMVVERLEDIGIDAKRGAY